MCFDFQFRNFKIVYRRYAGLYFCICVDVLDNNLAYLEAIHNFVEVLNEYFHNVCELDLVFNFYKVSSPSNVYMYAIKTLSNYLLCEGLLCGKVLSYINLGMSINFCLKIKVCL